jgi:hypothetical protein
MDRSELALALSAVTIVPTIYGLALPSLSEARSQADDRGHLQASEHYAAVLSVAVVLGIAGVTRSPQAGAVGLLAVVALSGAYRHAVDATP